MWTGGIRICPCPYLRSVFEFWKLRKMFLGWPYVTTAFPYVTNRMWTGENRKKIRRNSQNAYGNIYLRLFRSICGGYGSMYGIHAVDTSYLHWCAVGTDTCGGYVCISTFWLWGQQSFLILTTIAPSLTFTQFIPSGYPVCHTSISTFWLWLPYTEICY